MELGALSSSSLYNRRQQKTIVAADTLAEAQCALCKEVFQPDEQYYAVDELYFHPACFTCAQCFNPLGEETYFKFGRKLYCEYDYCQNYAPVCQQCRGFVIGTVLKTVRGNYHPECLKCDDCDRTIETALYVKNMKCLCGNCYKPHTKVERCAKCRIEVLPEERIWFRGDVYHANHFDCKKCSKKLDNRAQIWRENVYCQECYDHRLMRTCAHCHKVIDSQNERCKQAGDKFYHVDHIFCFKCGLNLKNAGFFPHNGENYCMKCRLTEIGVNCEVCQKTSKNMLTVFGKHYCQKCFRCVHCQKFFTAKSTIANFDNQPTCKKCFDKLPKELRKRLKEDAKATSPKATS
uniref:LIM domain-containing protein n=1 Tax=Panagrellus redivivus TaxID=6233 RepID=A0A7E4UYB4_PANRE